MGNTTSERMSWSAKTPRPPAPRALASMPRARSRRSWWGAAMTPAFSACLMPGEQSGFHEMITPVSGYSLIITVPGLAFSATNTIMAGSFSPLSTPRGEMNILKINKKLRFELEERKQCFRDLKEKLLMSEATVYNQANQLWKYKCGDYKIIKSVLGEKLQPDEGELAEKLTLAEKLRASNIIIEDQARKLSQLTQKLQQGRDVSLVLSQHLQDLLTQDPGSDQGQGFQEQLAEGCWIGNNEDEGNDNKRKWLPPRLSREGQEERVKEALKNSLDECLKTSCSCHDLSDTHHPLSITAVLLDDHGQSSLDSVGTQHDQKQKEEEEPVFFREVQEDRSITAVLQDSLDERYLVHSSCSDLTEFHQPPNGPVFLSEEDLVCSSMTPSENKIVCKAGEGQEVKASRKHCALIHDQARELTQLRQQLQEGRDTSLSLSQHLKDLLTQKDPDFYQTQGFREQLDEGRSLVERLVCKLSAENHENEEEKKEKEPLSKMNDTDRELNSLIQVQARDLTQLRQKLQEGREAASFLSQHVNELFTQDDFDSQEGQNPREQLAEGCRLAQCLARRLCPENLEDEDDDDEEQVPSELDSRNKDVLAEVQVGEVTQLLQQLLLLLEERETYFSPSQHLKDLFTQKIPNNHQRQDHGEQLTEWSRLVEPFVYKKGAENRNGEDDDEEESLVSSRHTSHLQEDKVKEVFTDSLGEQYFHPFTPPYLLDSQELLRGSALPLDGPKVSPALNQDKVNSDASFQMRKPATKEGDTPEGSVENTRVIQDGFIEAASVLKEKIIKGKPLLSKWRIACRFPGPGYKELNLGARFEMKLEDDAPKGSVDHKPGFQHSLTDVTNVRKWKILKRKLLFSRCRIVCRFAELEQTGLSCPTAHVTSVYPYLEFPWASTWSGHPSPSPVCTEDCVPKQRWCPDTLSARVLNSDVCFEMELEGDAPEGSVDYTPWFQHGLIDATNVLKGKIMQRKLLFSRCRIVCIFPELEQTGLFCPIPNVSSECSYLECPRASTWSVHPSPSPVCIVECVPTQHWCPDTSSALVLNSDVCFEMELEGDAPEGSVDYTPWFQHGLIDATNVLKGKIMQRKLLFSRCRIVCIFPELEQTGLFCPIPNVSSECSYLECPRASTWSVHPSPSPVCIVECVPTQHWCPDTSSALVLNSDVCFEMELEGDAPEGSVDYTPWFQHGLIDATNVLKGKIMQRKLLFSRCRIVCIFPELEQTGLFCPIPNVSSECSYLECPRASTWSVHPSPSPVCIVECVPTQHWCPDTSSALVLNSDVCFEMELEGDAPEGSVDYTPWFQHGLIDATNVLKGKIMQRKLLFSRCRIVCIFPELEQTGLFCPIPNVSSECSYLECPRASTWSVHPSPSPVCIVECVPTQHWCPDTSSALVLNSDVCFEMELEGDAPEGSVDYTPWFQHGLIDATNVLKGKIMQRKLLFSRCRIVCIFPELEQTGLFCPIPNVSSECSYLECPRASTWSVHPSPSPVCIVECVPTQHWCPDTSSALVLNSDVCFEMELEGDAPEGSVDYTPWFQHGLIDATNVLKGKIMQRKLLFSRCRIVCIFPELEQTGLFCPIPNVSSECSYLECPRASTWSVHPSPSPVCIVECVPTQHWCPDTSSALVLNSDVCFEMELEGDAPEGSVDYTPWFQHGLIDATNVLKGKIMQRKLLFSRCRIVCIFPELEQTGLFCPIPNVSSECSYLECPRASTWSVHPSPSPVCIVECVPTQHWCPDTSSALVLNSDVCFEMELEGDAPEGSVDYTPWFQHGLIDATNVLKGKIMQRKLLFSRCRIVCIFPELEQTGLFCPIPNVSSECSYLECPRASTWSVHPSPSPVCIVECVPTQHWCPDTSSALVLNSDVCFEMELEGDAPEGSVDYTPWFQHGLIDATNVLKGKIMQRKLLFSRCRIVCIFPELEQTVLNSDVCFEMELEGDAPEGSVDYTPWFQHGLIDATNVLKGKIMQRKLLFSRCRIVCIFPELEQTGLFCPIPNVSSECSYLECPRASTWSVHPSPSPVCIVECVPTQHWCPDTSSALELNSDACFEVKLEGSAPEGPVDHTPGFQHGLINATNDLKRKILKTKQLFSRCQIGCRFPELGRRGLSCITAPVISACSYLGFPWAATWSGRPSPSPVCTVNCVPTQRWCPNILSVIKLNLNAFFGMKQPPKIEGDVPEDSVDHACGIHHGFIDAPNVLKQKVIKRILLLSKRRIESRFPGSTYRGMFCPTSDVISIYPYLGFLRTATLSDPPSTSPVCILNAAPPQCCHPHTLNVTDTKCCWNKKRY
ncbi:uncharacterized protein isoform X6 [Castor canadensis]|uniref:Uncharacterized protein isoform X6 n=1 Tax=Castor canadensis TaxID=51338 RepID=A0AC58MAS7_CASCN